MLALVGPAAAHRQTPVGSTSGLSLPSVSHGQMVVLADNRAAILDLAERQVPTDSDMREIQSYVNLQYFFCLWGLMPGALTNEASPFNECTHAYLAGVRALLLHLQVMPGDRSAVRALSRKIDVEMLANHASMVLCRYSDEPFNTADVVAPRWSNLGRDGPTLAVALTLLFLVAGLCGFSFARRTRYADGRPAPAA